MRRYLMAVATSLLVLMLMFALYQFGYLEQIGLIYVTGATLFLSVLFYALFRAQLNLRAHDPSLTIPMMLSSILVTVCAMYFTSSAARDVLTPIFLVTSIFGVFRLRTRELMVVAAFISICYGLMLALLIHLRPEAVDLRLTMLRWGAITVILLWFALMGGYISRLRKELKATKSAIEDMAMHDELTGTFNRRYLMETLQREKSRCDRIGAKFCVCMVDLDFFKVVNDTFGHQVGDEVLRAFSRHTLQGFRGADCFGRYGGEEFMLILLDTTREGARIKAERLRSDTEKLAFANLPPEVKLTTSIGVAEYRPGEDIEETQRRADAALYKAKEAGRNRVELEAVAVAE
jgi:diguanylate cyclase (GGDEF)-like protein